METINPGMQIPEYMDVGEEKVLPLTKEVMTDNLYQQMTDLYVAAFRRPPWNSENDYEVALEYIKNEFQKDGFKGFAIMESGDLKACGWLYETNIEEFLKDKYSPKRYGEDSFIIAQKALNENGVPQKFNYISEIFTDKEGKGQGSLIAKLLDESAIGPTLVRTDFRTKITEIFLDKLGYKPIIAPGEDPARPNRVLYLNDRKEKPNPTYCLTQDSRSIVKRIANSMEVQIPTSELNAVADAFWLNMIKVLGKEYGNITALSENLIQRSLDRVLNEKLLQNKNLIPVSLDRYLPEWPVARFEISRMQNVSKQRRQGTPNIEEQLKNLKYVVGNRNILLIDDGVFSGGTMKEAIKYIKSSGLAIQEILVVLSQSSMKEIDGIPLTSIFTVEEFLDWNDGRDVTQSFGGKPLKLSRRGRVGTSKPYISPYDDGKGMSLDKSSSFNEISKLLLSAEEKFLKQLGKLFGREITLKDAIRAGYPIPINTNLPKFSLNEPLVNINRAAQQLLNKQDKP